MFPQCINGAQLVMRTCAGALFADNVFPFRFAMQGLAKGFTRRIDQVPFCGPFSHLIDTD